MKRINGLAELAVKDFPGYAALAVACTAIVYLLGLLVWAKLFV